jgi:hypothetical protein
MGFNSGLKGLIINLGKNTNYFFSVVTSLPLPFIQKLFPLFRTLNLCSFLTSRDQAAYQFIKQKLNIL